MFCHLQNYLRSNTHSFSAFRKLEHDEKLRSIRTKKSGDCEIVYGGYDLTTRDIRHEFFFSKKNERPDRIVMKCSNQRCVKMSHMIGLVKGQKYYKKDGEPFMKSSVEA